MMDGEFIGRLVESNVITEYWLVVAGVVIEG